MAKGGMFRSALLGGFRKEDVRNYIGGLEEELESEKGLHEREKEDLMRRLSAFSEKQAEEDKRIPELESALEELRVQLEEARKEMSGLRREAEAQQARAQAAEAEAEAAQTRAQAAEEETKAAQAQIRSVEKEAHVSKEEAEEADKAFAQKEEQLKEREEALSRREEELARNAEELRKSEEELRRNREEAENAGGDLSALQRAYHEVFTERETFAEENNKLKISLAQSQHLYEVLKRQSEQQKRELEKRQNDPGKGLLDYEIITKVLEDANHNAEMIEADAHRHANEILAEARKGAERQIEEMQEEMSSKLQYTGIQLVAAKHKINQYMSEVKRVQEGLYQIYDTMGSMSNGLPARLDEYWRGESYRLIDELVQDKQAEQDALLREMQMQEKQGPQAQEKQGTPMQTEQIQEAQLQEEPKEKPEDAGRLE